MMYFLFTKCCSHTVHLTFLGQMMMTRMPYFRKTKKHARFVVTPAGVSAGYSGRPFRNSRHYGTTLRNAVFFRAHPCREERVPQKEAACFCTGLYVRRPFRHLNIHLGTTGISETHRLSCRLKFLYRPNPARRARRMFKLCNVPSGVSSDQDGCASVDLITYSGSPKWNWDQHCPCHNPAFT